MVEQPQPSPTRQNMPMTVIGMLLFASHFLLLAYFFISGNVLNFWSNRWIISLLFIAVLLIVALALLYLADAGGGRKMYAQVVFSTGISYLVISALLYGTVAVMQLQDSATDVWGASGLFTLFLFFFMTGLLSLQFSPFPRLLRSISYVFLSIFAVYLIALAWKYLAVSPVLVIDKFMTELLLLAIGVGAFGYLFVQGTRYRRIAETGAPAPRR